MTISSAMTLARTGRSMKNLAIIGRAVPAGRPPRPRWSTRHDGVAGQRAHDAADDDALVGLAGRC